MPPSRRYEHPVSFVLSGGSFPAGPFQSDTPTYARVTAGLVRSILSAMQADEAGTTIRSTSAKAGINPGTLSRLLRGEAVPDLGTIAALEEALRADLWPGRV